MFDFFFMIYLQYPSDISAAIPRVVKFLIGNILLVSRPTFVVTIATYIHILCLLFHSPYRLVCLSTFCSLCYTLTLHVSSTIVILAAIVTFDSSIKKEKKKTYVSLCEDLFYECCAASRL